MDFIYMEQGETKAGHYFPDQPNVIEAQEARGWVRADPLEEKPFVPDRGDIPPEQTWVTLYHPEVGATHEFPNNEGALKAAYEAGWKFPEPEPDEGTETDEAVPETHAKKRGTKKDTSSAKAADDTEDVK